jgi:hypothetical protein
MEFLRFASTLMTGHLNQERMAMETDKSLSKFLILSTSISMDRESLRVKAMNGGLESGTSRIITEDHIYSSTTEYNIQRYLEFFGETLPCTT